MPKTTLEVLQSNVGGCRQEDKGGEKCWAPAEYVLWGKLLPPEALGPRCYDHAAKHVHYSGLRENAGWALINLSELAAELNASTLSSAKKVPEHDVNPVNTRSPFGV